MHLISIFLATSATPDNINCVGMGCEPVGAMAQGLGDERTCSGVVATVPGMNVIDDLAPLI
jgi:hypothetical protein